MILRRTWEKRKRISSAVLLIFFNLRVVKNGTFFILLPFALAFYYVGRLRYSKRVW